MRVGIDARMVGDSRFPGIGRYVAQLIAALATLDSPPRLTVMLRPGQRLGAMTDTAVERMDIAAAVRSWREQAALARAARQARLDLFHAPFLLAPLALPCALAVGIYDLIGLRRDVGVRPWWRRFAYRALLEVAMRRATRVITLSHAARCQLTDQWPWAADKVRVTPAAPAPVFRRLADTEASALIDARGLPDRFILNVGSDRPHRNRPRLLQAWQSLARERRPALLVVGTEGAPGPTPPADVHVLGRVDDALLCALYNRALCCVIASLEEGFGLPALEAMACGTPVVCSDIAALREVTGDVAVMFEPDSHDSIAEAIARTIQDHALLAHLREAGLARAAQTSWKATAIATRDVYVDALRRGRAR